ncbi:DUF1850 domain-containing protein [Jeotgalibacillus sp. R-1-5s-1]|uniref:DUF1850 domain-containing protein n=1 Tax=Jeotgalibacillus sp. R-1-5s-1 TaxID=2555897 RepID=UPI00106C2582|nr:DUF1850 domain-containing protein [Jeotgalibacillus sp. R-1-5s-1]TFD97572.1 DUF1850 domain-containing protein [Jeotgalibacillus sp. R-1-5s-1]
MKNKNIKWILIIFMAGFIITVFFLPFQHVIAFHHQRTNELLAYIPANENAAFQLEYTHSIHRSPVIDYYEMTEDNQIRQTALEFEDTAIGMPSNSLYEGETFVQEDGKFRIENMNRLLPAINLYTSQVVVSHVFRYNQDAHALDDYIEPGTAISISVKDLTLWELLRGVKMDVRS